MPSAVFGRVRMSNVVTKQAWCVFVCVCVLVQVIAAFYNKYLGGKGQTRYCKMSVADTQTSVFVS